MISPLDPWDLRKLLMSTRTLREGILDRRTAANVAGDLPTRWWPAMGLPEKWISSLIGPLFSVPHFGFPGPERLQRPPSFLNCKVYFRVSSSCIFWSCPCAAGARLDRQTVVSFLFWFLFPCFRKLFGFFAFPLFILLFYFAFRLVRFSASSLCDTAPNVPSGSIFALTKESGRTSCWTHSLHLLFFFSLK